MLLHSGIGKIIVMIYLKFKIKPQFNKTQKTPKNPKTLLINIKAISWHIFSLIKHYNLSFLYVTAITQYLPRFTWINPLNLFSANLAQEKSLESGAWVLWEGWELVGWSGWMIQKVYKNREKGGKMNGWGIDYKLKKEKRNKRDIWRAPVLLCQ